MNAVLVIMLAGMRKKKLQTTVFAVCCLLCSFFLVGAFVLNFTIDDSFDAVYEGLGAPNVVISMEETDVTERELLQLMDKLSYVQDYNISKRYLASNVKLPYDEMEFAFLSSNPEREPETGSVIVNNVVNVGAGDEIKISINGQDLTLKVDSFIVDPVNSAPESKVPYFWISESELQRLTQGYEKGNYLVEARFENAEETASGFAFDYEQELGYPLDGTMTTYQDIKKSYLFRYEIFGEFFLFLCAFLFVIILVITVLLSKMAVQDDRKRIGILKSMGFTNRHISRNYILQYVIVAIAASMIGVFLSGILIQSWLSGMFLNIGSNLFKIKHLWLYQCIALLFVNVLLYFAVRFSIRKIVNISPIEAIYPKEEKKHGFRWDIFLPTPRFLQLNLALIKNMQRQLESLFVFVLALGISLLYMTCVYLIDGVKKADVHLSDWGIVEMDIYVSRKANMDEEKSGLLTALVNDPAVDFYYAALSDNIIYRLPGSGITRSVLGDVYDKSIPRGLEFEFTQGRNPKQYHEAAVGMNFAKENNLGLGDTIFIVRNGVETRLEIVGIYPSFKQHANNIRFLTSDINAFFENKANGYYSVVLHDGENINAFAKKMAQAFPDFGFHPMERSTARSVGILLPPLALSMLFLGLIFFLIILCMTKLMMIECRRDLDIYRSVGFRKNKVKAIVKWRFIIPIFVGTVMAVPLSIDAVPEWMRPIAHQLGLSKMPVYPNAYLVIITLVVVLVSGLTSMAVPLLEKTRE